ncbi:MAG: Pr6Pr family membrane protein [Flavobacteriales bacterium]|nr:Pr6Pr family membrane protein [Flavobacteriales bacterium]
MLVYALLVFGSISSCWPIHGMQGAWKVGDVLLHYIIPMMYVFYWLMVIERLDNCAEAINWRIFPIGYAAISVAISGITGAYPYPFLVVEDLGWTALLRNIIMVLMCYIILSLLVIALDKSLFDRAVRRTRMPVARS